MTGNWTVRLEDGTHQIQADLNPLTGQLAISWDRQQIDTSFVLVFVGEIRRFERNSHVFAIRVKGVAYFGGHLALVMDGVDVDRGVAPAASPATPAPSPTVQFVRDLTTTETDEIVGIEDYPLDNTFGGLAFTTDRQVSKESKNECVIESADKITGNVGIDLFHALNATLSAELSKRIGYTIGETVTESQTLHFSVAPGSSVVYKVIWKRKVRSGEQLYLANGTAMTVPYRVTYGLSCEVRTEEVQRPPVKPNPSPTDA
jgi:hypothetical protein